MHFKKEMAIIFGPRQALTILVVFFLTLTLWRGSAAADSTLTRPDRIVSLNLCADQYLLTLADPSQIRALTHYAQDPTMSFMAEEAKAFPMTTGDAEAVISLKPDLIITNPYQQQQTQALISRFDFPTIAMPVALDLNGMIEQIQMIATAIGYPERGDALIEEMTSTLAQIDQATAQIPKSQRPTIIHYQRRGFVTGTQTLLNEIMDRAAVNNLASQLNHKSIGKISMERILLENPDYLLTSVKTENARDIGTQLLNHPALSKFSADRRLYLSRAEIICEGPSFPHAIKSLYEQVHGH